MDAPLVPHGCLPITNFRDVGGYKTIDGCTVRGGFLFRSANLANLSRAGMLALQEQVGIHAIFDLRSGEEFAHKTDNIEGIDIHRVVAMSWEESRGPILEHFQNVSEDIVPSFLVIYKHLCTVSAPAYRSILISIRDNPEAPTLIHCDLGKDRTGIFIGIVLKLLGVAHQDIIDDYHRSEKEILSLIPGKMKKLRALPILKDCTKDIENHFMAPGEVMRALLIHLDVAYGGAHGYLKFLGFSDRDINQIKANLIRISKNN